MRAAQFSTANISMFFCSFAVESHRWPKSTVTVSGAKVRAVGGGEASANNRRVNDLKYYSFFFFRLYKHDIIDDSSGIRCCRLGKLRQARP